MPCKYKQYSRKPLKNYILHQRNLIQMFIFNWDKHPGCGVNIRNDLTYRIRNGVYIVIWYLYIICRYCDYLNMNTNVLIGVCYRPPYISTIVFIETLDEILQKIQHEIYCLFCGDFNTLVISPATYCKSN